MHIYNKKHIILVILLLYAFSFSAKAQINHFIYLQTDNKQPFYIKHNSKIYSSTLSGYLILSKLSEGLINFTVGFPQSQTQEQKFELQIDKTEKGFLLKNFNEKGWGLFDLQSSNVTYTMGLQTVATPFENKMTNTQAVNDPFANMLSTVTQDSTVKFVTVKKEEKIVIDTSKSIVQTTILQTEKIIKPKTDSVVNLTTIPTVIIEPQWAPPLKTEINKLRLFQSKEGSDVIYVIKNPNGTNDTVRLFVPLDSLQQIKTEPQVNLPVVKKDTISVTIIPKVEYPVQSEIKKEEPEKKENPKNVVIEKKEDTKTVPNSNCAAQANEDDFIKLRRKMASQSKDEAMVIEAKKVFKTKCFSTDQLKNLSVLFLSDEWRYRLFDAALPFVSDFSNFRALEETLKDEYYKKRFQALLPNQ